MFESLNAPEIQVSQNSKFMNTHVIKARRQKKLRVNVV